MRVSYYPDTTVEDGVPVPADRPEAYRTSGVHRQVWMNGPAPTTVVVKRHSDDAATDKWLFDSDAELGDDRPREVSLVPKAHVYTPLKTDRHAPYAEYRRAPPTQRVDATLGDVPPAVLSVLEDNAHVEVVASTR